MKLSEYNALSTFESLKKKGYDSICIMTDDMPFEAIGYVVFSQHQMLRLPENSPILPVTCRFQKVNYLFETVISDGYETSWDAIKLYSGPKYGTEVRLGEGCIQNALEEGM
jgi:hypothetical protein